MTRKILLPFGLLLVLLTACSGLVGRSGKAGDATSTPVPDSKILGMFYPIDGTHYQMAAISTAQDNTNRGSSYELSELFTSRRYEYGVYNYVFLDVDAEKVYALLPDNSSIIASVHGYPMPEKSTEAPQPPIAWWLYTVQTDTDKDGDITLKDLKTLSISDVGGLGYTELIHNVEYVLTEVYKDNNTLLVLYHAKDKNFMSSIDLTARKVIKTSELPSFGDDVK